MYVVLSGFVYNGTRTEKWYKKFQTFIGEFLSGCNMSNTITS